MKLHLHLTMFWLPALVVLVPFIAAVPNSSEAQGQGTAVFQGQPKPEVTPFKEKPLAEVLALKKALNDDQVAGHWIYDDIAKGLAQAKASGKPLLVLFR